MTLSLFSLLAAIQGCTDPSRSIDTSPVGPGFEFRVQTLIIGFTEIEERFFKLRVEYNEHLGANSAVVPYLAQCNREFLISDIDTAFPAIQRLQILHNKIDALVNCAWRFEQIFSAHYNAFHGEWHPQWAKFYSPVPDNLSRNKPLAYIRCVEQNLEGLSGFINSLQMDFKKHFDGFH